MASGSPSVCLAARSLVNVQIVCALPSIPLKKKKASIRIKDVPTELRSNVQIVCGLPSIRLQNKKPCAFRNKEGLLSNSPEQGREIDDDDGTRKRLKIDQTQVGTKEKEALPSHAGMLKIRFPDTMERRGAEAKASMQRLQREREPSGIALEKMEESAAATCDLSVPSRPVCESLQRSRADMLKKRFADTTIKTQQKQMLFVNDGDGISRLKLERREAEAKASMERRQREREASGIAIKKMETCDIRAPYHPVCESLQSSRADMLKKRFADTIIKTQKQALFVCDGDRISRLKSERREAEAKAAMERRERDREVSRIAIENTDRSAAFEDNISIMEELAYLIGDSSFAGPLAGTGSMYVNRKRRRPLERFGLYLKEDDYDQGEFG